MTRFLQVRKVPTRQREPHRVPQHTTTSFSLPHPAKDDICPVKVDAGDGMKMELSVHAGAPALFSQSARDIALMLRRWLKNRYGTMVRIISAGGDAKIRYHRKLRRMVKEINRVLFGIVPQVA
jgi:hypothetical protein